MAGFFSCLSHNTQPCGRRGVQCVEPSTGGHTVRSLWLRSVCVYARCTLARYACALVMEDPYDVFNHIQPSIQPTIFELSQNNYWFLSWRKSKTFGWLAGFFSCLSHPHIRRVFSTPLFMVQTYTVRALCLRPLYPRSLCLRPRHGRSL